MILDICRSKLQLFYVCPAAVPNGDEVLSGVEALQAQGVVSSPIHTVGSSVNRVAFLHCFRLALAGKS